MHGKIVAAASSAFHGGPTIIKDPMVPAFLGLKWEATFYKHDLETALLLHLQEFILELDNGFSFVARQRIGVYYNKCKTSKMKCRWGSGTPSSNIIFN